MKKRKIRRDFKIARIIALSLVALLSILEIIYLLFGGLFSSNEIVVLDKYQNNFTYDYKINTKNNEFVDYTDRKDYSAYVTNLIENIDFNFKYSFKDTSEKYSVYKYTYTVEGRLIGLYNKDTEEQKIFEKDNVILASKTNTVQGTGFDIDENFNVNLAPLNELVNNFKAQQEMQISSKYDVVLKVEIEELTKEKVTYSPKVSIEIGGKTTKITGDSEMLDHVSTTSIESYSNDEKNVYVSIVFGLIAVYAICKIGYLLFFTEELMVIKNKYKSEINEIIRNYQDKIVMVTDLPEIRDKTIITVFNIEEIAKLSEELYKPILCYEDEKETCTDFIVVSDDVVYKFKINK